MWQPGPPDAGTGGDHIMCQVSEMVRTALIAPGHWQGDTPARCWRGWTSTGALWRERRISPVWANIPPVVGPQWLSLPRGLVGTCGGWPN